MPADRIGKLDPSLPIFDHCPAINKPELAQGQRKFYIPDKEVMWWQCPLCRGWHVALADVEDDAPDDTP